MTFFGGHYMWIFWIIVICAVVVLVVILFKKSKKSKSTNLDILKKRYAKGEISKKEFEEKKRDLQD